MSKVKEALPMGKVYYDRDGHIEAIQDKAVPRR